MPPPRSPSTRSSVTPVPERLWVVHNVASQLVQVGFGELSQVRAGAGGVGNEAVSCVVLENSGPGLDDKEADKVVRVRRERGVRESESPAGG